MNNSLYKVYKAFLFMSMKTILRNVMSSKAIKIFRTVYYFKTCHL